MGPGMKKGNIGSTFDSWLKDQGIYEEVSADALARVADCQIAAEAWQAAREDKAWTLERADAEILAAALAEPAAPGLQLAEAAKRYRERFLRRHRPSVTKDCRK